jgi:hypothetical protein
MKSKPAVGLLAFVALAAALLFESNRVVHAASVTLSWSFDYSVDPGCASTAAKNCVIGFEFGTTPDNGVTLNKIGSVPNPSPLPTTMTNGITAAFKQGPPYGSIVYYVRSSGVDGGGNPVFSAVAVAQPVQVNPGQPLNVTVTSVK